MDATAIIAIYAAAIATAGLLWQIYAWWHRTKSHVTVDARIGLTVPQAVEIITITVKNRSEHPVRVEGAGIDLQDRSGAAIHLVQPVPGATLPGAIAPHDSGQTWMERDEAEQRGINVLAPVTVWVRLATGEVVKSKPSPLLKASPAVRQ